MSVETEYQPPPLLFFTRTQEGILANILVDGTLHRMPISPRHALHMVATLSDLVARELP